MQLLCGYGTHLLVASWESFLPFKPCSIIIPFDGWAFQRWLPNQNLTRPNGMWVGASSKLQHSCSSGRVYICEVWTGGSYFAPTKKNLEGKGLGEKATVGPEDEVSTVKCALLHHQICTVKPHLFDLSHRQSYRLFRISCVDSTSLHWGVFCNSKF